MRFSEFNILETWKEFSLEKPDEQILNHYDVVKNHTDLNGELKHKNNREVIKVFSIFLTHNYGSYIYELCHFIKYLNEINLPIYNAMIMNSNDIISYIKKYNLKKENEISNKFTLQLENNIFDMSYSRISTLIIILDFVEEFIGIEEVILIDKIINKIKNYRELRTNTSCLSKKIYNYLKNLLPSSYIQTFSAAISNQIMKENNNDNHTIVTSDISDSFILNFWINISNLNKANNDVSIKTFALAADYCLVFKKSISLNTGVYSQVIDQINESEPWNHLSQKKVDELIDQLTSDDKSKLNNSISYIKELQKNKVNILKKNQVNELKIFSRYDQDSLELPLTIIRANIFGNVQNKIIENLRRKKTVSNFEMYLLDNNLNYKSQITIYEDLIKNIDHINNIIFYKLWLFCAPEAMQFIRNYLNKNEIILFNKFLNEMKINNLDVKDFECKIDMLFRSFQNVLESGEDFKSFKNNIKQFKKSAQIFRRNGFDFNVNDKSNDKVEMLNKTYKSLSNIQSFLFSYLNELKSLSDDLSSQFIQDKNFFFECFHNLYNNKDFI